MKNDDNDFDLTLLGSQEPAYEDEFGPVSSIQGWALMPCTETMFDQETVNVREVGQGWPDCTAYICERQKRLYICTSAAGSLRFRIGSKHQAHHDQTSVDFGTFEVKNIVAFKSGKLVRKANNIGMTEKLGVLTFK